MSCPICGEGTERKYRPFCSKRCADIDLGKWLSGSYAIPEADPSAVGEDGEEADSDLPVRH